MSTYLSPKYFNTLIWIFVTTTLVSIFGFGTFGQHPELLSRFPHSVPIYGAAFPFFGKLHTLLALCVVLLLLITYTKFSWWKAFAATYLISFLAELGGTSYGIPFGHYTYSEMLGPKLFEHVPILIPASWFTMAICAYKFVSHHLPQRPLQRVLLSALMLTVWDLSLDPAMSHLSTYWQWTTPGRYYSMPWPNLIGWFLTSTLIMSSYELLGVRNWLTRVPLRGATMIYGINAFLPWGMIITGGLFFGASIALLVTAAVVFSVLRLSRNPQTVR